jgi:hypothetical protein
MKTYRVRWEIDIDAENAGEAAKQALAIQRDPSSTATVFDVRYPVSNVMTVDVISDICHLVTPTTETTPSRKRNSHRARK